MKKKVVKAHRGMAHVPLKSKSTGTKRKVIGLPQQFKGAASRRRTPMPQTPAPVRRTPVMQEPKVMMPPKPVVRPPPKQSDAGGGGRGRGVRPVRELPNKGRRILRRT